MKMHLLIRLINKPYACPDPAEVELASTSTSQSVEEEG